MKSLKNPISLYSRLALITSITLVVGYFVVYAWTTLELTDVESNDIITTSLMQGIVGNINDLNTRVSNFSFSAGNVGIGATTTTLGNQSSVKLILNGTAGAKNWQMDVGALSTGYLNFTPSTVNGGTTFTTPVMVVGDTGRVGIGIATPGARLHTFADPQTTFPVYIGTADDNNGSTKNPYAWQYVPGLLISNDWDGDAALVNSTKVAKIVLNTGAGGYNNGGSIHAEGAGAYNNGQLIFSTGWDSNSLGTERMRLNWLGMTIKSLAATYTNSSAFVCVNNSGQLYASESACP